MSIIGTMSLAGTIALVFYYLVKLLFREKYSAYWKMALLKISMFFYLCPFQLIKYLLPRDVMEYLPDFYGIYTDESFYFGQAGYVTVLNPFGEYVSYPVWKIALIIVWLGVAILFVIYELTQYFRMKHLTVKCSERVEIGSNSISIEKWEKCLGRKGQRVQVLSSCVVESPFTMGVIRPLIFIPETELDDDEREMIYLHEITHIKNHDILIKFLCLLIILLHWFNPFSYLVLHEFNILSEYCCDESVMKMRSLEDRKKYAILLVQFATERKSSSKTFWVKGYSGSKKRLKKRVGAILEMKKKKSWVIVLAMVMSIVLGSTTVYAYKAGRVFESNQVPEELVGTEYLFDSEDKTNLISDFENSDSVFIDIDGNYHYVAMENDVETYAICIHSYKTGVWSTHVANNSGGCTVYKYDGKLCMKCGKVVLGDLISTETFVKCPH